MQDRKGFKRPIGRVSRTLSISSTVCQSIDNSEAKRRIAHEGAISISRLNNLETVLELGDGGEKEREKEIEMNRRRECKKRERESIGADPAELALREQRKFRQVVFQIGVHRLERECGKKK